MGVRRSWGESLVELRGLQSTHIEGGCGHEVGG